MDLRLRGNDGEKNVTANELQIKNRINSFYFAIVAVVAAIFCTLFIWSLIKQEIRSMNPVVAMVYKRPPRILKDLEILTNQEIFKHIERKQDHWAYFALGCECGVRNLAVQGYPVDSEWKPGTKIFAAPFAVHCAACNHTVELFDPRKHGNDGEEGFGGGITGEGSRVSYSCSRCGETIFELAVGLEYGLEEEDFEDDPSLYDKVQDYFHCFALYGKCCKCGHFEIISDYECA